MINAESDDELSRLNKFLATIKPGPSIVENRKRYDRAADAFPLPEGVHVEPWSHNGLSGEWLVPQAGKIGKAVLYLHGGGFCLGSTLSHRHLAAALAVAAQADILVINYRTAPEYPFPAALDDALNAYQWLLSDRGDGNVAIAGDSAGGGLALSTVLSARSAGLPLPTAVACISPWVDMHPDSPRLADDYQVTKNVLLENAQAYLGDTEPENQLASPINGDFLGFPPMIIQTGSEECLRPDADRLAAYARAAGVQVTLEVAEGMPHVWHWYWPRLTAGKAAINQVGAFLRRKLCANPEI